MTTLTTPPALTTEDRRWLAPWLLRQAKQHQIASKRAYRAKDYEQAAQLADLSRRLWRCGVALETNPQETLI